MGLALAGFIAINRQGQVEGDRENCSRRQQRTRSFLTDGFVSKHSAVAVVAIARTGKGEQAAWTLRTALLRKREMSANSGWANCSLPQTIRLKAWRAQQALNVRRATDAAVDPALDQEIFISS
jgi:hypothetical protein